MGFAAPWIAADLSAGPSQYDSDARSGRRVAARVELGKRISESLDVEIGVFHDRRYASFDVPDIPGISGDVFTLRGSGGYARAGYAVTDDVLVSGKLAFRRGDVVSTTVESGQIIGAATAIAEDATFGHDLYDYRLSGSTRTVAMTVSKALDQRSSLNLSLINESTHAAGGFTYRSNAVSLIRSFSY